MDPLTALSLAGTIIRFVGFGSKLFGGAKDIYKSTSGSLSGNDELELFAADINSVLFKLEQFSQSTADNSEVISDNEKELKVTFKKICKEANNIAEDLVHRLDELKLGPGLKGPRKVFDSLYMALKSAWSAEEIQKTLEKLRELKRALETRVLFSFRELFDLYAIKTSQRFDHLDQQTQSIVAALVEDRKTTANRFSAESLEQTATLVQLLSRMELENRSEHRRTRAMLANSTGEIIPAVEVQQVPVDEEAEIRRLASNKVLESLNFETMTHRYEEVAEAHSGTFNWIFSEEIDPDITITHFADWLKTGEGLY